MAMSISVSKLGLAAAQFGLDGGSSSAPRGRTPEAETRDILNIAARAGLSVLDASGLLRPRRDPAGRPDSRVRCRSASPRDGPRRSRSRLVEAEARATLRRIGVERADSIIVHSPSELCGPHGAALWDRLHRLKDQGLFAKIGVAAHATDDPVGVAAASSPTSCRLRPRCSTSACWPTARCNASPAWASRCICARSS
jgi:aryl-alcohol dehydrogenase-like predicted oxidoreductase